MNHGGILLLMLFPWVTALLVAFAVYDDRGIPPVIVALFRAPLSAIRTFIWLGAF